MQIISSTDFRKNIPKFLKQTKEHWEPIAVKTQKSTGVFISLEHWNSMNETAYLSSSPKNIERLRSAKKHTLEKDFESHNLLQE